MRKKLGLSLGAGSTKGFAHIGVLQVLIENNIPVDMVAGCSMGAIIGAIFAAGVQANPILPDVEVNVPPEVFSSSGQNQTVQPCNQCCIYQNQNYSEGAVVKADGILLQCQRDERAISTNPLVWRRVKQ